MTINGGKPHAVGYRGQRYEVTFFNPATSQRHVLGWSSTLEGAESMVDGINKHPAWEQPQIVDRHEPPNVGAKAGPTARAELTRNP